MFKQITLSYGYNDLEPFIDAATVETHYAKHHATYTKNFNDSVQKAGFADKTIEWILGNLSTLEDEVLRNTLKNNGGGFYNHNLYFEMFSPDGIRHPVGELSKAIEKQFGSDDKLIEVIAQKAAGQFGSGWAFLSTDTTGVLTVSASPNQDNPISENSGNIPLLALDVWEHAYYLKYRNLRSDYIKAFFEILDWSRINERYVKTIA